MSACASMRPERLVATNRVAGYRIFPLKRAISDSGLHTGKLVGHIDFQF